MIHVFLKSRLGVLIRKLIEYKNFKLENKHNGEACYIFGDGVSIKYYDLSKFNDKIGIACNHFPFHKDFKMTKVKYAILSEPYYFMPFFDRIIKKRKVITSYSFNPISYSYRKIVRSNPKIKFFINLSNYFFLRGKNVLYLYRNILSKKSNSTTLCKEFDCDKGVLRRAISLAAYLGFKTIYLVGCDYLENPQISGHWYENYFVKGNAEINEDYMGKFIKRHEEFGINFKLVSTYPTKSKIENITYDELFNVETNYRENTELLSKINMQVFSKQRTMKL